MSLEIDPSIRQGRFVIGDDGSFIQTRGVKVTGDGEPVTGKVADLVRQVRLSTSLHQAVTELDELGKGLGLQTPEGRAMLKKVVKGIVKLTGVTGKPV